MKLVSCCRKAFRSRLFLSWFCSCLLILALPFTFFSGLFGNFARLRGICCRRLPERKVCSVKIILIRTPGILSPLLRRLFGIRRQKLGR